MWIVQAYLWNSENIYCTDKMYSVQKSTVSSTLLGVNTQTLNLMHLFERKIFFPHKLSVENLTLFQKNILFPNQREYFPRLSFKKLVKVH